MYRIYNNRLPPTKQLQETNSWKDIEQAKRAKAIYEKKKKSFKTRIEGN